MSHLVQAVLTLVMWFTLWGSWRWGKRLGWWCARYQLNRMHQAERLHGLQLHLELLRLGSPLMVSAAREQELEYIQPLRELRRCEVCGLLRHRCPRTRLLDAGRPAPAGACHNRLSEGGYDW